MCRKTDPESNGKIENIVKFVKQNFLYNHTFYDLQTLNKDGLNWVERTANMLAHGQTKKAPAMEPLIEQPDQLNGGKPPNGKSENNVR
jgi:transposase